MHTENPLAFVSVKKRSRKTELRVVHLLNSNIMLMNPWREREGGSFFLNRKQEQIIPSITFTSLKGGRTKNFSKLYDLSATRFQNRKF